MKQEETSQMKRAAEYERDYQQFQHDKRVLDKINWIRTIEEKQQMANHIKNQFEPEKALDKKQHLQRVFEKMDGAGGGGGGGGA